LSQSNFDRLLQKYLAGECTEEEEKIVLEWYEALIQNSELHLSQTEKSQIETKLWSKITANVQEQDKLPVKIKSLPYRTWLPAAAVLMVIATGVVLYLQRTTNNKQAPMAQALSGFDSLVNKTAGQKFDAAAFSKKLWDEKLPARLDNAIELTSLIHTIEINPVDAFAKYSNAMDIGNYRYSLVKVTGTAAVINENEIIMQVNHADSLMIVKLATEYIYGNAIRDASALVDIKDFTNTTDLNSISEELNKTVRTTVLPPFKKNIKQGNKIEVTGAIEMNKEHIKLNELELIPVRVKILQ